MNFTTNKGTKAAWTFFGICPYFCSIGVILLTFTMLVGAFLIWLLERGTFYVLFIFLSLDMVIVYFGNQYVGQHGISLWIARIKIPVSLWPDQKTYQLLRQKKGKICN